MFYKTASGGLFKNIIKIKLPMIGISKYLKIIDTHTCFQFTKTCAWLVAPMTVEKIIKISHGVPFYSGLDHTLIFTYPPYKLIKKLRPFFHIFLHVNRILIGWEHDVQKFQRTASRPNLQKSSSARPFFFESGECHVTCAPPRGEQDVPKAFFKTLARWHKIARTYTNWP